MDPNFNEKCVNEAIQNTNCDCKKKIDERLKEKNLQLTGYAFVMPGFDLVPQISTQWLDKSKAPKGEKNSPPAMLASHCPWCGLKIKITEGE